MIEEIYNAGYATPEYGISSEYSFWRFRNEHYKTPLDIPRYYKQEWIGGIGLALIEDVRRMSIK